MPRRPVISSALHWPMCRNRWSGILSPATGICRQMVSVRPGNELAWPRTLTSGVSDAKTSPNSPPVISAVVLGSSGSVK